MKWEELDHQMAEDFIYKVFKTLYGNQYENYSYDDVLEKIKLLKEENYWIEIELSNTSINF